MLTPRFIKGFVLTLVLFLLSDVLWHTVIMADFYNSRLAAINGAPVSTSFPPFAVLFEIIAAAVFTYFVQETQKTSAVTEGMLKGGVLGLLVASAINFIDHSLITKWDLTLTLVDTAWGTVTGVIVGGALAAFAKK